MSGPKRILVADDDAKILKVVGEALRQEGHIVETASDGARALQLCRSFHPNLVILDVMMPELDGLEVCGRLRAAGSQVPVLILSAAGDEMDRVVGFRMGADDYLVKPFSLSELLLRVKAILRRLHQEMPVPSGDRVTAGDLVMDRATRQTTMGGAPITLTPREFELLWLLATHPGQVFTRELLIERIWESNYEGDPSVVAVYMRRLRERIERNPSAPDHLKTVWGIGYKFEL
ncbi:MAG TPA: response regulator transcription factor [Symbiobacteriaceae bacterium]|jgi:DNA-binding response OmpR family regulator|nr:response regulator transcription factor [Symbiobacteriaceae bacterium]